MATGALAGHWRAESLTLLPRRVLAHSRDRRWETFWIAARQGPRLVGLLAVFRVRSESVGTQLHVPHVVAPALAGRLRPATEWLHIGGFQDLASGPAVATFLSPDQQSEVKARLITEAVSECARQQRQPVALYVRSGDIGSYRKAFGSHGQAEPTNAAAVIDLPGDGVTGYLAALSKKHRYRVRREWDQLSNRQLWAQTVGATSIADEAADLVVAVNLRHGVADHPRLAAMRLAEWAAGEASDYSALTVRDSDGTLTGVSFVAHHGEICELHELGMAERHPDRHLLYTELLVHGPLRYAATRGAQRLLLGLDSPLPKTLRGARLETVWSVTHGTSTIPEAQRAGHQPPEDNGSYRPSRTGRTGRTET